MARKKKNVSGRYRNPGLLKRLGAHCQRLRIQRGYSIDRMSKESDQLSPSVIHRLETGSGAVTVAALFRYAEVLELPAKALLDFDYVKTAGAAEPEVLTDEDPATAREAFKTLLPLYSLKAAAGYFGHKGEEVSRLGWVKVASFGPLNESMFVVRAVGESMQPKIRNGDFLVMRSEPLGTRQGKIVLAQYKGPADPETGGSYTVKKYGSAKFLAEDGTWRHREIRLLPANPAFEPIILEPKHESDFKIIAECLGVLRAEEENETRQKR